MNLSCTRTDLFRALISQWAYFQTGGTPAHLAAAKTTESLTALISAGCHINVVDLLASVWF